MIINRLQPIVRWTLAIILMFAGAAKLVQTDAFARGVAPLRNRSLLDGSV